MKDKVRGTSVISATVRGGRQTAAERRLATAERMAVGALLERRRRIGLLKPRESSVGVNFVTSVSDERVVDRVRALVGCATRPYRPPGDW